MGRKMRYDFTKEEIMAEILLDLLNDARIGSRHIACEKIVKNFRSDLVGMAKDVRDELIDKGIIIKRHSSKKGYWKCSLNPKKINEILTLPKIKEIMGRNEFFKKRIEKYFKRKIEK